MALTKQISNRALILSPSTAEVTTAQTIAPYYDFRIDGVLGIPINESFDAGRYVHADQTFSSAKVSVRVGGDSEYDIVVKSYDSSGGDEVTHINLVNQVFATSNSITTLSFVDNEIAAERTLVLQIFESVANTPVEDFCLTIISSTFADLGVIGAPVVSEVTGPPGLTNTQAYNLDFGKALAITATGVDYASADDVPSASSCIGIAKATAAPAGPISLVSSGLASNVLNGLGFTAGDEVFLGLNGNLVDSATAGTYPPGYVIKQVGFALNALDMWVQIADAEIIS